LRKGRAVFALFVVDSAGDGQAADGDRDAVGNIEDAKVGRALRRAAPNYDDVCAWARDGHVFSV